MSNVLIWWLKSFRCKILIWPNLINAEKPNSQLMDFCGYPGSGSWHHVWQLSIEYLCIWEWLHRLTTLCHQAQLNQIVTCLVHLWNLTIQNMWKLKFALVSPWFTVTDTICIGKKKNYKKMWSNHILIKFHMARAHIIWIQTADFILMPYINAWLKCQSF